MGYSFCGGTEKGVFLREISGPKGLGPLVMNLYSKKIKNGLKRIGPLIINNPQLWIISIKHDVSKKCRNIKITILSIWQFGSDFIVKRLPFYEPSCQGLLFHHGSCE